MVRWKGWGIVAGLIWVACLLVVNLSVDAYFFEGYYKAMAWPKILASALCVAPIWYVGRAMNAPPPGEVRGMSPSRHTMFNLPVEYWGPVFFVLGIVIAIVDAFRD